MNKLSVIYKIIPKRHEMFDIFHYANNIQNNIVMCKGIKNSRYFWAYDTKPTTDSLEYNPLFTNIPEAPLFMLFECDNYSAWKQWNDSVQHKDIFNRYKPYINSIDVNILNPLCCDNIPALL